MAMSGGGLNEQSRRYFLSQCRMGLGGWRCRNFSGGTPRRGPTRWPCEPHASGKIKQVIFLFMAGGPSQLELFSDKPVLREMHGQAPPKSLLEGRRFGVPEGERKAAGEQSDVRPPRRVRDGVQRTGAVPRPDRRQARSGCGRPRLTSSTTAPRNCSSTPVSRSQAGQASDHGSPMLGSPSENLPGSSSSRADRAASRRQHPLVERLPADELPGVLRNQGDPILALRNPPGHDAPPSGSSSTPSSAQRTAPRQDGGSRDRDPDQRLRNGIADALQRLRS